MNDLRTFQNRQDLHYKLKVLDINEPVKFHEYLAVNPTLYDGVDLDKGTVDYLNQYFWDYELYPRDFQRKYIVKLKRAVSIYNNLKKIELNDEIFNITNDSYVRNLVTEATNNLERTGGKNATSKTTGTIKDDGEITSSENVTTQNQASTQNQGTTKQAAKTLPMKSGGAGFDNVVNWNTGASGIEQNSNNSSTNETNNGSATRNNSEEDTSTRTYNTQITDEDITRLSDLGTSTGKDHETLEVRRDLVVDIVDRIWNYLVAPKAIDYLTKELSSAFLLVI